MRARTEKLIRAYYDRFNAQDVDGFVALLSTDVVHDISQGGRQKGRPAFRKFLLHMNRCYKETARNVAVMATADGTGTRDVRLPL